MKKPWMGVAIALAMALFSAAVYGRLPERLATHWNFAGKPDGWSGRAEAAWMLPAVALALWGILWLLPRIDPRRANYARFSGTYALVVNLTLLFLAVLHAAALGAAIGWPMDMGRLANAMVGLLFVAIGNVLPRVQPNWVVGIRTPWTLESDRMWRQTHRLGDAFSLRAGPCFSF